MLFAHLLLEEKKEAFVPLFFVEREESFLRHQMNEEPQRESVSRVSGLLPSIDRAIRGEGIKFGGSASRETSLIFIQQERTRPRRESDSGRKSLGFD